MRVVVVYKTESDHARAVFDYLRDFKNQTGHDLEEIRRLVVIFAGHMTLLNTRRLLR